jgi:hypothetical protein
VPACGPVATTGESDRDFEAIEQVTDRPNNGPLVLLALAACMFQYAWVIRTNQSTRVRIVVYGCVRGATCVRVCAMSYVCMGVCEELRVYGCVRR